MNESKKSIVVFLLIVAIIFIISIDIYLVYQTNKTSENEEDKNNAIPAKDLSNESEKRVLCYKEQNEVKNENIRIKYSVTEEYAFYVTKGKEMMPDGYITVLTFDSLEDLNVYYDYAVNVLKLTAFPDFILTKSENNLTLSYYRNIIQGGYTYYETEYQELLKEKGYTCEETENKSS